MATRVATAGQLPQTTGCYGLGANSYVRKPVDFAQFVDAVKELGLYWLVINQPLPT